MFDTPAENNDAYHALKAVDSLIMTGATGTNVNDVAVSAEWKVKMILV